MVGGVDDEEVDTEHVEESSGVNEGSQEERAADKGEGGGDESDVETEMIDKTRENSVRTPLVTTPVLMALPPTEKCPELCYDEDGGVAEGRGCDEEGEGGDLGDFVRGEEDGGGNHLPVGVFLWNVAEEERFVFPSGLARVQFSVT